MLQSCQNFKENSAHVVLSDRRGNLLFRSCKNAECAFIRAGRIAPQSTHKKELDVQ